LISGELGLPDFSVANIVPAYMLPYGFGALLYAFLTRYFSYRSVMTGALVLHAIFNIMFAQAQNLNVMLLAQVGAGIAGASSAPLSLMIIGDFFQKEFRGRIVGLYFGCAFFSSLIGMMVMGIAPWRWLFWIPAVMSLLLAGSIYILKTDLLKKVHGASVNYFKIIQAPVIHRVFILIAIMSFLYHAVQKWYGLYLYREYGLSKEMISVFLIIAAMCGLAGQNIGGYLADKKGRVVTCFVTKI
jgi:predicted MFS family arabinose efflux permease